MLRPSSRRAGGPLGGYHPSLQGRGRRLGLSPCSRYRFSERIVLATLWASSRASTTFSPLR